MWSGLYNCIKARRVKGNVGVRVMFNGRRACKANTILIVFPTKIIPQVVLFVNDSCNLSQRDTNRARQTRSRSCVSNYRAPLRRRRGCRDMFGRRWSRNSSRRRTSDKLKI